MILLQRRSSVQSSMAFSESISAVNLLFSTTRIIFDRLFERGWGPSRAWSTSPILQVPLAPPLTSHISLAHQLEDTHTMLGQDPPSQYPILRP